MPDDPRTRARRAAYQKLQDLAAAQREGAIIAKQQRYFHSQYSNLPDLDEPRIDDELLERIRANMRAQAERRQAEREAASPAARMRNWMDIADGLEREALKSTPPRDILFDDPEPEPPPDGRPFFVPWWTHPMYGWGPHAPRPPLVECAKVIEPDGRVRYVPAFLIPG